MECRMDGRVALITGASTGLGKAMAETFARSGASVALVARRADPLNQVAEAIKAVGGKARAYPCDVTRADQVSATYAAAVKELGKVDILVNNAGQSAAMPFEQVTDQMWEEDIALKLYAAVRFTRAAFPDMKSRRWGRVINVLATAAKAPGASSTPTSVSRAAGMALMKALSNEGAAHNVLVNALLVGLIESDQWVRRHSKTGNNQTYEQWLDAFAKDRRIPIGRMGQAQEFANMACFLCSDAGSYITGTAINVDGGLSPVW
ncbi:SDR family NAD(P)-dependent oxidoreductase [Desertibaculum subflavum]|uniref:SDR family NAD(P)-dependent oxidoreductase n=1 Tax=Desertibaculum subflavum TaxID=2268458 RepID=UPI000E6722BF